MSDVNTITISGNLTDDPKLYEGKKSVARFTIAANNGYGDYATTTFVDCVAFGKAAENIAKHFAKGRHIVLQNATLMTNSYENNEGERRTRLEIHIAPMNGWTFGRSPRTEAAAESESETKTLY